LSIARTAATELSTPPLMATTTSGRADTLLVVPRDTTKAGTRGLGGLLVSRGQLGDLLLETLDLLEHGADRPAHGVGKVGGIEIDPRLPGLRVLQAAGTHHFTRNADDRGMRLDRRDEHRTGADPAVPADRDRPEHLGAGEDRHRILDRRM